MKNFEDLIDIGSTVAAMGDRCAAHERYTEWVDEVRTWIAEILPESGLSAEWSSLGSSDLVLDNSIGSAREEWMPFREMMHRRLAWLSTLQQERLTSPVVKALRLARELEHFHFCEPCAPPDEESSVVYSFKYLAKRFVGIIRQIPGFVEEPTFDFDINTITEAYDLYSDLQVVIDTFRNNIVKSLDTQTLQLGVFINRAAIDELKAIQKSGYDVRKLIRFCEEINSSYAHGNLLAVMLLLRAVLNHIPPIFGCQTFKEAVAHLTKSVKSILQPLENIARDLADHHTHALIRHNEPLPTPTQVDLFRPAVEVLLHEVATRLKPHMS